MRKYLFVLLVLASFGVTAVASAQEITVGGTVTLKKKPEIASFELSVQGKGKSGDVAQQAMLKSLETVLAAIKKEGLQAVTLGYRITEDKVLQENQKTGRSQYVVVGFIATTTYVVKVGDLAKLPKALGLTSLPGVSRATHLDFSVRDTNTAEREARALAVEDAISNATALAKGAGKSGFDIVKIQQNHVEFRDPFGGLDLPMDSIRSGGKVLGEDGDRMVSAAMAITGGLEFNDSILVPGDIEVTTSVVMLVKIK